MRFGDGQHLEHRAHAAAAAVGEPLQCAGNIGGHLRRGLAHQRDGAGLDAEPLEEFALRYRAVDPRAEVKSTIMMVAQMDTTLVGERASTILDLAEMREEEARARGAGASN